MYPFCQTAGCACNTPCVASLGGLIKQINRSQCSPLKNIGTKDEQQRKKSGNTYKLTRAGF